MGLAPPRHEPRSNYLRLWQLWRAAGVLCAVSGVGSVIRGPDFEAEPPPLGHVESAGAAPGSDLGRGRFQIGEFVARCRKSIGEPVGAGGAAVLGHGGAKEPVGPLLGQGAGLADRDRHARIAHSGFAEGVGNEGWADPVESEQLRVPVLYDDRGPLQRGQPGQQIPELASLDDVHLSRALLLAVGERCSAVRGPRHLEDAVVSLDALHTQAARRRPCCKSSTN